MIYNTSPPRSYNYDDLNEEGELPILDDGFDILEEDFNYDYELRSDDGNYEYFGEDN